jgi:hypothetical protein
MKSSSTSEWVKAYEHIHQKLTSKGFKPKLQTLDNEASTALKSFLPQMTWSINLYHLTSIYATLLNGFVAGLASVEPDLS